MKKYLLIVFFLTLVNNLFSQWQMLPGPGDVKSVLNMDFNNNELFITISNNIYKTENFGNSWLHLNKRNSILFNEVKSICKVNNMLFLYQEYTYNDLNQGIYLYKDDGDTWEQKNEGINFDHNEFKNFYKYNDEVYSIFGNEIYKFDKDSEKWTLAFRNFPYYSHLYFKSLCILNDKIIIGALLTNKLNDSLLKKYLNIFIYSIKDETWLSIPDSISDIRKLSIINFAVKNDKLYAATSKGVYLSIDGGFNWIKKSKGLVYGDSTSLNDYEIHKLFVNKNFIYAIFCLPTQTHSLSKSTKTYIAYSNDDGENWIIPDITLQMYNPREVKLFSDKLLIGTREGLYSCSDDLSNTELINKSVLCGDFTRDISNNSSKLFSVIGYGIDQTNAGMWESSNGGESWLRNDSIGLDFTKIAVNDSFIIVGNGYYEREPWFSINGGKSFQKIIKESGLKYLQTFSLKIIDSIIYSGTKSGIYKSIDWGATWQELSSDIQDSIIFSICKYKNFMFAGSKKNLFFISQDSGKTWSKTLIPYNKYDLQINDIKVIQDKIYIVTQGSYPDPAGYGNILKGGGVFVSSDFGSSWQEMSDGYPSFLGVTSFENYNNHLFISVLNGGVYYSYLYHDMWYEYNIGLTNTNIYKLMVKDNYLYAATAGGMYRVPLSDFGIVGVEEIERKNYLYNYPPYPNPATDEVSALIYWDLLLDINSADIKIYDVYGNQVADKTSTTLEEQGPYYGKLTWHCKGVPPGVYLVNINYGTEKKTIKVCVVE